MASAEQVQNLHERLTAVEIQEPAIEARFAQIESMINKILTLEHPVLEQQARV